MNTQAFKNSPPTPPSEEGTRGSAPINKGVNKKENLGNGTLSKKQEAKGIPKMPTMASLESCQSI